MLYTNISSLDGIETINLSYCPLLAGMIQLTVNDDVVLDDLVGTFGLLGSKD